MEAVRSLFHMSGIYETSTAATPSGLPVHFLGAGKAKQFNSRERKDSVSVLDFFCLLKLGIKKLLDPSFGAVITFQNKQTGRYPHSAFRMGMTYRKHRKEQ